jgi:ABC-type transporter Mla subunit MlaD
VATDPTLRVLVDADMRLAAAIAGAARYLADAAGLEGDAVSQLQAAILAACREAFDHLPPQNPRLEATLTRFADRIEVTLSHPGENSPAVGLDTIAGFAARVAGDASAPGVFAGVDRVQYESRGSEAVTRLTKYIGRVAPSL